MVAANADDRRWWSASSPALADAAVVTVLALATLLTRALWYGDPVADFDEQLYSFIGWRLSEGELPFVEWWDRKPFGLFAIFAFAHSLGGPGPLAYQVLASLFALTGALLTYLLSRPLVDRVTAGVAGVFYLVLIAAYGSYSGQSEVFHVPLMLGMAWLLRDPADPRALRRALIAMTIGGLALQVKYTVLPQCLFFGLYALWGQWRSGASPVRLAGIAAAFAALGLMPTMLVGLLYAALGHFDAFVFANFVSFFDRAPGSVGRWRSEFVAGVVPLVVLTVPGLYVAFRVAPPRDWRLYGFYCGWAAATLATVFLPATVYLYYFAALAPVAVLLSLPLIDRFGPLRFLPALLLLVGAWYILFIPERAEDSREERRALAELSAAIAPHVDGSRDCLWVFDGPTALYRLTGSCVPTRYVYPDHLNNILERDALEVSQTGEVARILATGPAAIVTADRPMTPQNQEAVALVREALAADYRPVRSVTINERQLTAWLPDPAREESGS